ncbi:energy-coupling factor transporter transmembrane component T family protein [Aliihoeflea sp. PC F10.4]
MISTYQPGTSIVHRLPAGSKIFALAAAGTALFFVSGPALLAACVLVVLILYPVAGLSLRDAAATMRPLVVILVLLVLAHVWLNDWQIAIASGLRLVALVLLAGIVTLTTPASAMMAAIEKGLSPLARLGVDVEKISLALSLALRFIPMIASVGAEVREAQRARGLDGSLVALAVPLIVRTLKMGEEIADAIDARGFGSTRKDRT